MSKTNIESEIRRIVDETAATATAKALEVSEQAKQKAAEVSSMAIAKALDASTLAATRAAEAASAAATIAASTSKDLEYIKADIAATKLDVKEIKEKLDNRYVTKEDFNVAKSDIAVIVAAQLNYVTKEQHAVLENSLLRFSDKMDSLAKIVYTGSGIAITISVILKFFIK